MIRSIDNFAEKEVIYDVSAHNDNAVLSLSQLC